MIESLHCVLLHCPTYEYHRAAPRSVVASLPQAHGCIPAWLDDGGSIALQRDDFMGGAKDAAVAADALLRAVITYILGTIGMHYIEQSGG